MKTIQSVFHSVLVLSLATFYRGFSVYATATNLLDKSHQLALGYPALGRGARIGLRYQFAGRD